MIQFQSAAIRINKFRISFWFSSVFCKFFLKKGIEKEAAGYTASFKTNVLILLFTIKLISSLIFPNKIHNIFSLFFDTCYFQKVHHKTSYFLEYMTYRSAIHYLLTEAPALPDN